MFGEVFEAPQTEKTPFRPISPYGAAKASARHLTKVYRESYDLYAIHCILYNHESERRGEEFVTRKITKNVARIHDAIKNNTSFEPLELGNIEARRDWSHAQDFVEAIWIMLNQNKPKEYILSSNETHTVKEFVEKSFLYANITGFWRGEKENEKFIGIINNKEVTLMKINPDFYRPAEVELLLGDSSLARKDLNWNPKISFDKLVEKMTLSDIQNFKS
jgi:GDPmannose 4,6-dehydratase